MQVSLEKHKRSPHSHKNTSLIHDTGKAVDLGERFHGAYRLDKALLQPHSARVSLEKHERPPQDKALWALQKSIQQRSFKLVPVPHAPDIIHRL